MKSQSEIIHFYFTVQNECWRRVWAEGTCCISTGGPNASDHAAGQGNLFSYFEMSSIYLLLASILCISCQSIFDMSVKCFLCTPFYILNMFVCHNADLLLQLAMRGPTGPMGLTGRPGLLVCIFTYTTLLLKFNIVKHVLNPVILRVLLVCQD